MTVLPKVPFNPFTYVDIHKVVNREFAIATFNESITIMNGLIVLGSLGLILTVLCYMRFKRLVVE